MKNFKKLILLFFALVSIMAACKKNKTGIEAELDKLPPITQTGANTFGCLVNGVAWLPNGSGSQGQDNIQIYVDPTFQGGRIAIDALQYKTGFGVSNHIGLGAFNCKNVGIFEFTSTNPLNTFSFRRSIQNSLPCSFHSNLNFYRVGVFNLIRYDLNARIFSGTFECKFLLKDQSCNDTINITNGRFDIGL